MAGDEKKGALLALDLGTTTGYAVAIGATRVSGIFNLKPSRFEGAGMRYLKFRRRLDELHASVPIQEIVFEEVRRHKGVDAAHAYGGFLAVLSAWCEDNNVPYSSVPVQTIKGFATGRKNAHKDTVIAAVRSWGYDPADDNQADAIALLHYQLSVTGAHPREEPPADETAGNLRELLW